MKLKIEIDLKEKNINVLYDGYNIIATTIYNKEIANKIIDLITTEIKNNEFDFENLEKFLTLNF